MKNNKMRWLRLFGAFAAALTLLGASPTFAQGESRTFPETGKTVQGVFLKYWNEHGGLAQQGYPISDPVQEVSPSDGKTYTVQYFERAVFEEHPEFAGTDNEVELSLLGVFRYNQLYPDGEPGQAPSTNPDAKMFTETGYVVGGVFLDYWNNHGGVAQQGYPITNEFNEVSPLDGKTYIVQYFQRAEFEFHPEYLNTPNQVLLSQLGTFAWRDRQTAPTPGTATPSAQPTSVSLTPTEVSTQPASTPTVQAAACDISGTWHGTAMPVSGGVGTTFQFTGTGFFSHEDVTYWISLPNGNDLERRAPVAGGSTSDGTIGPVAFTLTDQDVALGTGRWTAHFRGDTSLEESVIYFCVNK